MEEEQSVCVSECENVVVCSCFGFYSVLWLDETWPCFAKGPVAWLPKWTHRTVQASEAEMFDCI